MIRSAGELDRQNQAALEATQAGKESLTNTGLVTFRLGSFFSGTEGIITKPHETSKMQNVSGTILILDDGAGRLQPWQSLLQAYGWEVTLISDTEMAFSLLEKAQPDIVLVDHQMARLTGIRFVERARLAFPHCRFIMMTGAPDESVQEFCRASGIRLLIKPFRVVNLLAALRR